MEEAINEMKERVLPPATRDWNYNSYYADETDPDQILGAARELPLFSNLRIVVVKNCERLHATTAKRLLSYLSDPCETTCMVFVAPGLDKRSEFRKSFDEGSAVEFYRLREEELIARIRRRALSLGKRIDDEAVHFLIETSQGDLRLIYAELDKASTFASENEEITLKELEELSLSTSNIFILCNALGERKLDKALKSLEKAILGKEAPVKILATLATHMRKLIRAREMLKEGKEEGVITKALNIHWRERERFIQQAREFPEDRLRYIFDSLLECDLALKTSGLADRLHLERFIIELCRPGR